MNPTAQFFALAARPIHGSRRDWSLANLDGTFGNRSDDPAGIYRVLYASSQRLGCYLDTGAVVDIALYAELAGIEGEDDFVPLGEVPQWLEKRIIGIGQHDGSYADLYASEWIGMLRHSPLTTWPWGVSDLDAAVPQSSGPKAADTARIASCFSEWL